MTRGEIYWADYGVPFGSEAGFRRPVVIVQDNEFNVKELRTVIAVPLTTNLLLAEACANVFIEKSSCNLSKDSVAVVSQVGAIDKNRLLEKIGRLSDSDILEINAGLKKILSLD